MQPIAERVLTMNLKRYVKDSNLFVLQTNIFEHSFRDTVYISCII